MVNVSTARTVMAMLTNESGGPRSGAPLTCGGCGHAWTSNAKDGSTVRCPRCSKPRKVKRAPVPAAAAVKPAMVTDAHPPSTRPPIPGLQPATIRRCDYCSATGRRGSDGRYPVADWLIRITFPDGSESDGNVCTKDVRALVAEYAGRGVRIRLDPADPR